MRRWIAGLQDASSPSPNSGESGYMKSFAAFCEFSASVSAKCSVCRDNTIQALGTTLSKSQGQLQPSPSSRRCQRIELAKDSGIPASFAAINWLRSVWLSIAALSNRYPSIMLPDHAFRAFDAEYHDFRVLVLLRRRVFPIILKFCMSR